MHINTVGTFGVASASYYLSRVAASVGRITQYISGRSATTWHQLVADVFHLEAGGLSLPSRTHHVLRLVCNCWNSVIMEEDCWW